MSDEDKKTSKPQFPADLTCEQLSTVNKIISHHRLKQGSLIPVLEDVQEVLGYLPKSILEKIAVGLGISYSEVWGVVTFYSFFTTTPRGRHNIRCCMGTACYVRGGQNNLEKLTSTLQIEPDNTTEDRRFSLETVRCVGACGLAPVITVGEETFGQVKAVKIPEILDSYK